MHFHAPWSVLSNSHEQTEDKELIISFCQCLFRQIDGNNENNEHIKEEYNSSIVD